jgi:hypothetical protein
MGKTLPRLTQIRQSQIEIKRNNKGFSLVINSGSASVLGKVLHLAPFYKDLGSTPTMAVKLG